jgi:hypothetical protein
MSDVKSTDGFYIGKEFSKQGTTKDNKEYIIYKIKFKPFLDSEKQFSFSVFEPMSNAKSIKLAELIETTQYNISYTERQFVNQQGQNVTGKTCIGIYPYVPGQPKQQPTMQPENMLTKINSLNCWQDFIQQYMAMVPVEKRSVNHMFGTYVVTYFPESMKPLLEKCKAAMLPPVAVIVPAKPMIQV